MEYGFNKNLCVLRATKSIILSSTSLKKGFENEFSERFDEKPDDKHTREAQFIFLLAEFMENGLDEFLEQ